MLDIIYNEKAGNGKAKKVVARVKKMLEERNIPYRVFATEEKHHATIIAKDLSENGSTDIIAIGGDGTIHEVVNGIDLDKVNLGIIPAGSGNDFASNCHIPQKTKKALDVIIHGNVKPTDIMECSSILGINSISTGIDVDIVDRCNKNTFLKGKFQYLISLIVSLMHFHYYPIEIVQKHVSTDVLIVVTSNGAKFGGGIKICPKAKVDDGYMDLLYITKVNLLKAPLVFLKLMAGKIHKDKVTHLSNEAHITIKPQQNAQVNIDGELYPSLNYDTKILKGKLRLYRP